MSFTYNIFVLLLSITAGIYQFYGKPALIHFGRNRVVESVHNEHCTTVSDLQACEKTVLHQPSGLLYLACSTQASRSHWTPYMQRLNATGKSHNDYVAIYDPVTSKITHLTISGFSDPRGLSLHGMDVVPSATNPSELFVYLVNHRVPLDGKLAREIGADSAIEVFTTRLGSSTMTHVRTVEDFVIITPNDIVGAPDGQSFFFTNDHGEKTGYIRELELVGRAKASVGYCHVVTGCKLAITGLSAANGIVRASNDTFYVSSSLYGRFTILERQLDNSLVVTDVIRTDRGLDNLSIDDDGVVWAAGLSDALKLVFEHYRDVSIPVPSSALRLTRNTGPGSFYGEKYNVDKVFEDDGTIASAITSVVHDARKGLLFLHGSTSPQLAVCKI